MSIRMTPPKQPHSMNVVINACTGNGWYKRGQARLVESLRDTGYTGDILSWCDAPINRHFDPSHPYTIKGAAFAEASKKGYKNILWLDCSIIAIKSINPLFELINTEGKYFWKSGWNMAQTATDTDLEFAGWTRDQAELLHECASGIVGLNMHDSQVGRLASIFMWAQAAGVCSTSRKHDNQSKDPRFKFARQDQTAFSIAFHKAGFKNEEMFEQNIHSAFYGTELNESVSLIVHGM